MSTPYMDIAEEVRAALSERRPVVALESTIISHGMPYPRNVETALALEQVARAHGAVPATIAIIKGRIKAGLTPREIDFLGQKGPEVTKVSRRDMPVVLARALDGATTVAATMFIAAMAGIRVFATGGIGGVHRGAQHSFDVSADLQELARTDVAVVSAGAKAILDIGLTLEYLETMGVPVIGYKTDEMPAFYTRSSGFRLDIRADSPVEIARILKSKWDIGLRGGALIANPIPSEHELDAKVINAAIESALSDMEKLGIRGKEATPFLLARIVELTGGESLEANIGLVRNNVGLAVRIAAALLTQELDQA